MTKGSEMKLPEGANPNSDNSKSGFEVPEAGDDKISSEEGQGLMVAKSSKEEEETDESEEGEEVKGVKGVEGLDSGRGGGATFPFRFLGAG